MTTSIDGKPGIPLRILPEISVQADGHSRDRKICAARMDWTLTGLRPYLPLQQRYVTRQYISIAHIDHFVQKALTMFFDIKRIASV
jgi:hypothetical protein